MLAPSVNELPSGDLLLTGHSSALRLLKVTATGQVLAAAHTSGSNNGQHAINTGMGAIDVLDSSMSTTALIDDMELVFGYHTYTNGFWALGTNTLTGCGLEPVSVTSDTTSSANIITMDPETGASSLPIQCSVIDTTFTIAAALSPATFEFCGFLGKNEAPVRDHSIIIVGSPVSSGSGIPVESSSAATIDLLNSAGQCLASQRIGANTPEILRGSDALRAGIYLVRATDPQGHAIGTAKVIVE